MSSTHPETGSSKVSRAEQSALLQRLIAFGFESKLAAQQLTSYDTFWNDRLRRLPARHAKVLESNARSEGAYIAWFLFDVPIGDEGRTIVERFLEANDAELTGARRAYLQGLGRSHTRLYDVTMVGRTRLDLTDVVTGESVQASRRNVRDVSAGDLLAGRLTEDPVGRLEFEMASPFVFSARQRPVIMERLAMSRAAFMSFPGDDESTYFKWCGFVFHLWWIDEVVFAERIH